MQHQQILFLTVPLLCLLLGACASTSEVKKEDRDLSNSYDGVWVAKYETTKKYQKYKNWTFTCHQRDLPVWLRIKDSGIRTTVNYDYVAPLKEAYISPTGIFKTSQPSGIKGATSKYSDIDHSDVEIRITIEGTLTPEGHGTGRIEYGWATSNYKGCKTNLIFSKKL